MLERTTETSGTNICYFLALDAIHWSADTSHNMFQPNLGRWKCVTVAGELGLVVETPFLFAGCAQFFFCLVGGGQREGRQSPCRQQQAVLFVIDVMVVTDWCICPCGVVFDSFASEVLL